MTRATRWSGHTLAERHAMKVEQSSVSDCLLWAGASDGHGYGQINVDGKPRKAHRVAWELVHGPIAGDLTVDHLCMNRLCQNVAHMELVTRSENGRRGSATNARRVVCTNGHSLERDSDTYKPCAACRRETSRRYRLRQKESA